jgi:hypothetical protein
MAVHGIDDNASLSADTTKIARDGRATYQTHVSFQAGRQ